MQAVVIRSSFFLLLLLGSSTKISAQVQQVMHEIFTVDTMSFITVDLYDAYEVKFWPGSQIMLRTSISLYGAKKSVLEYFIERGRYSVQDSIVSNQLVLTSLDQTRATIRAGEGECYEAVELVLYLPEEFVPDGDHHWRRNDVDPTPRDTIEQNN